VIGPALALLYCTHHYNIGSKSIPNLAQPIAITLKDDRITESSGLAVSTQKPDVFFTHNDSGDTARIFAFDRTGTTLATLNLTAVRALDFEDMASASVGGKSYLYIGDIGDNSLGRKEIQVYRVEEPKTLHGEMQIAPETFVFSYPDGPHNAETLLIHPKTGAISIVAKTDSGPAGIYSTGPNPLPGRQELKRVGQVEISFLVKQGRLITGGAWSRDGEHVVLRTYIAAYEYAAKGATWWSGPPKILSVPAQPQSEAITYLPDGREVLTSSEGMPCTVYRSAVSSSFIGLDSTQHT
jgi:hypothetical protein